MYEAAVLDSVDINKVHVRRWFSKMGGQIPAFVRHRLHIMTSTMDCTYKGQHGSSPQLRGITSQAQPLGELQY